MSWFNRRPKAKEPAKTSPHVTSPMTEKKLKEAKDSLRKVKKDTPSK
jgi:hypothetical protein